jgi:hypothetical protein
MRTWEVVRNLEPYSIALALPPLTLEWMLVFKVVFFRLAFRTLTDSSELPSSININSATRPGGKPSNSDTSCARYFSSLKNGITTVSEDTNQAYGYVGNISGNCPEKIL